jgi:hypothetical protein
MFDRKSLLLMLLVGLSQLSSAADRKTAIREGATGASIASPVVGYFWSQTDGIAPVEGVAGAAHIGQALSVTDRVALPPGQAYAWMESPSGVWFLVLDEVRGQRTVVSDTVAAATGSDAISFSPNGSAAVLYFRSSSEVQIVSGLPDSAQASVRFAAPQSDCGALAVADDAATVLLACGGTLYSAAADRAWRPMIPGQVAAASFLPGSSDALAIMTGDAAVYGVSLDSRNSGVRAQLPNGMNDPLSLAVSSDGRFALAIDGDGNAAQLDLATSQATLLKVAQGMRTVVRGRDASTFLLLPDGDGVPWIVEARPGNPLASFAPRIPPAPGVSQF